MCIAYLYILHMYLIEEESMALTAKAAIKKFYMELLMRLPLDNAIFFGMAKAADLFPLGTADSIAAEHTRAEKVFYFLQHVVEPRADDYLPKLLKVMKQFEDDDVIKLADEIQAAIKLCT